MLGTGAYRGREYMAIIGIGQIEAPNQCIAAGHAAFGKCPLHRRDLCVDAGRKFGTAGKQAAPPFVKDRGRPARAEQPCLGEPQQGVPDPIGVEDISVENDDEPVRNVPQSASNS